MVRRGRSDSKVGWRGSGFFFAMTVARLTKCISLGGKEFGDEAMGNHQDRLPMNAVLKNLRCRCGKPRGSSPPPVNRVGIQAKQWRGVHSGSSMLCSQGH